MEAAEIGKLRWRCMRRGLLEVDIALSRFLDERFAALPDDQQRLFVELANLEDHDLWHLISGQTECRDERFAPIVALLRQGGPAQ